MVILALYIADWQFGFSFYYSKSKKLDGITSIEKIMYNPDLDSNSKKELIKMRRDILSHKRFDEDVYDFFSGRNSSTIPHKAIKIETKPILDRRIYVLSYSFWWLFCAAICIIVIPFYSGLTYIQRFGITAILLVSIAFGIGLLALIASFIPYLGNNGVWNYLINFFLQTISIVFFVMLGRQKKV